MTPDRVVTLVRSSAGKEARENDHVACEEPLELRLDGHSIAVLMRTPGHDEELATGFLLTEAIIPSAGFLRKIETRPDEQRILAFLTDDAQVDLGSLTRHIFAGSSCGICGKATLEAVFSHFPPLKTPDRYPELALLEAPDRLRRAQTSFEITGGLHAAGLFSPSGELLVAREDIGRHNAVDKVIGHAVRGRLAMEQTLLLVSGRVSFEIMQKALAARIGTVAAISAPSSLAIEFARNSGQTLIGFLRPPGYNRYSGPGF